MIALSSTDPVRILHEHFTQAPPDVLCQMLTTFVNTLLPAETDTVREAACSASSPERVNSHNGHRHRDFETRAGAIDMAIPKLGQSTYLLQWRLERCRRVESALTSVVATGYLLGERPAGWTSSCSRWVSP